MELTWNGKSATAKLRWTLFSLDALMNGLGRWRPLVTVKWTEPRGGMFATELEPEAYWCFEWLLAFFELTITKK